MSQRLSFADYRQSMTVSGVALPLLMARASLHVFAYNRKVRKITDGDLAQIKGTSIWEVRKLTARTILISSNREYNIRHRLTMYHDSVTFLFVKYDVTRLMHYLETALIFLLMFDADGQFFFCLVAIECSI